MNNYVSIDWAQPKVLAPCLPPKNGSKKGHKNGAPPAPSSHCCRIRDGDGGLIRQLSGEDAARLIEGGAIRDGMIPKTQCCIEALKQGVRSAHVVDGRTRHAILLEMFTDGGVGTLITR